MGAVPQADRPLSGGTPISIGEADDPRIAEFRLLAAPDELRRHGLFVAEGRLVVRRLLLDSPYRARSLLLTPTAWQALRDVHASRVPALPVYVADHRCLSAVAGFDIHRGCLALGDRPAPRSLDQVLARAPSDARVVVLEQVGNPDNLGGVFRNAAAFGVSAVALSPGCGDPLYRKAIRVSMGAALHVPFATIPNWPNGLHTLRAAGFTLIGLTASRDAGDLVDLKRATLRARTALLLGSEGAGLSPAVRAMADQLARIGMAPGPDSLNLATAAGVALHHVWRHRPGRVGA